MAERNLGEEGKGREEVRGEERKGSGDGGRRCSPKQKFTTTPLNTTLLSVS